MAKLAGRYLRVYLEDAGGTLRDVSAQVQSVEIPDEYIDLDVTGFGEGSENSIAGLPGMPVEITGLFTLGDGELYDVVSGIAGKASGYGLRVQVGQNAAPVLGDPEFGGEFWCSKLSFAVGVKGANVMTASLRVYGETAPDWDEVMVWVSSVSGDDGNSGLARELPKETIAGGLAVWAAGATMMLEKGSEWSETLTAAGAACTISTYGSGARPILDCADTLSSGGWSKTGGRTYVYERSCTHDGAGVKTWPRCWEDGTNLVRVADVATCDSTAGSYYVDSDTASPFMLYIHPSNDTDPASNGKTYEYNARRYSIVSSYANLTVSGVHCKRNLHDDGSLATYAGGVTLTDCKFSDGSKHSCYVWPTATVTNCEFEDSYYGASSAYMLAYNADTPSGENVTYSGCTFTQTAASGADRAGYGAIGGHRNTSGSYGTVTIDGCTFTGFTGINGTIQSCNHAAALVISDCTFTCNSAVYTPSAPGGPVTISGNAMTTTTTASSRLISIAFAATVNMTDNTLTVGHTTDTGYVYITAGATIVMESNAFVSNLASGNRTPIYCSSAAANLTIGGSALTGNTFNTGTQGWTQHYAWLPGAAGMTWTSDYNAFELTNDNWYIFGTTYTDFATYQAAVAPNDANSTSS